MTRMSGMVEAFANRSPSKPVTRFTQVGQTNFWLISKIKEMYGKPAALLADWLDVSERTAKRKLGCERELSAEEIGVLIRSEQGFHFVTAIMGDARPEWWRICATLMDAADIRKMQMAAQRRIAKTLEGALDADRTLSATIARAEALAIQDEEHVRPHIDALRSIGRVQGRTLASSKGRRR
jgi:hypothetical protein